MLINPVDKKPKLPQNENKQELNFDGFSYRIINQKGIDFSHRTSYAENDSPMRLSAISNTERDVGNVLKL